MQEITSLEALIVGLFLTAKWGNGRWMVLRKEYNSQHNCLEDYDAFYGNRAIRFIRLSGIHWRGCFHKISFFGGLVPSMDSQID